MIFLPHPKVRMPEQYNPFRKYNFYIHSWGDGFWINDKDQTESEQLIKYSSCFIMSCPNPAMLNIVWSILNSGKEFLTHNPYLSKYDVPFAFSTQERSADVSSGRKDRFRMNQYCSYNRVFAAWKNGHLFFVLGQSLQNHIVKIYWFLIWFRIPNV